MFLMTTEKLSKHDVLPISQHRCIIGLRGSGLKQGGGGKVLRTAPEYMQGPAAMSAENTADNPGRIVYMIL
jgi:hypothetical protein